MNSHKSEKVLLGILFVTGACVLVLEILAVRMLSPYFGNTIFNVSSVLTVILTSLSIGYYIGGKISDKKPYISSFLLIIFFSGLLVFLIQILNAYLLPVLGFKLPIISGPLVISLIMFFIPSILLGMLSPYVIKLATKNESSLDKIGSISGRVFFWSTLGSISGSLLTGFYLIPNFGITKILIGVGVVLCLISSVGYFLLKRKTSLLVVFVIVFVSALNIPEARAVGEIHSENGTYSKITVRAGKYNGQDSILLNLDRNFSSAVYVNSDELVFDYTKFYELYKLVDPEAKNFHVIGGGAYTIPRDILLKIEDAFVDVTEVEEKLLEISYRYFDLPYTDRLSNYVEDGRRFLHDSDKKYDLIFVDGFSSLYSVPSHLATKEFFELLRSRLTNNGSVVLNYIGNYDNAPNSFILSEMRTFKNIFPNSYFFAVDNLNEKQTQNIVFWGLANDKKIDFEGEGASLLNDYLKEAIKREILVSDEILNKHPVLTDNYAPVDFLVSQFLKKL